MDDYCWIILDSNQFIFDDLVMWVNLLYVYEEVLDCGLVDWECNGVVVFGCYQVIDKLELVVDYYFLSVNDNLDFGFYVDCDSNLNDDIVVYVQNEDFLVFDVQVFIFQVGYDVSDNV